MANPTAQTTALDHLRAALLLLKPTGPDGFEGLLAVILEKIAKQSFRLAKSGLQNGKDGETLATSNHVSFEGKLYTGKLPANEVQTKLLQLIGGSGSPDLWVLGATVEAGTQLLQPVQVAAARNGIAILILDWPETSAYPPLAVACAMAEEEAGRFLEAHIGDAGVVQRAKLALKAVGGLPEFEAHAGAIAANVRASSLALASATTANAVWLKEAFSDRARARAVFGQAVSPLADGPMQHRPRPALTAQIKAELMASPSRRILALVGGEGRGKTWLLADSWLEMEPRPLAIFVSASDLPPVAAFGEFLPFFIGKIIQQTGDNDTEINRRRWERRLGSWKTEANEGTPRFILCVDGLNQNPRFEWPRWLDEAAANVEQLGGVIIVTTRKPFFQERLQRSLHTPITRIEVPEWTAQELDEILREREIDSAKLTPVVRDRLRNPRILGIAFGLHSNKQIQHFTELSVERLLFEHIRASARDGTAPETPELFAKRLARHAKEILDRVQRQQTEDRLIFDQLSGTGQPHLLTPDLRAVTAEHFFQSVPGDATLYTLSGEGLSLALGLAIVAALRKAERNGRDAGEELGKLLEPVAALDMTADAVFSALMAASVDEDCSLALRKALLIGFLGLQNVNGDLYPPFVGVVRNAPEAALRALGELAITNRHVANKDWLSEALREVRDDSICWGVISENADQWLRQYSLDPALAVFSSIRQEGQEKFEKEKAEKAERLEGKMAALTDAERDFLTSKMIEVNHDPALLQQEAFALLAGKPLAPFADGLVAAAFSMSLHSNYHAPHEEHKALIRFNRQDWPATQVKLCEAASFLFGGAASPTGKWALVQLLRAVSREEDGREAHRLIEELTADREKFAGWRLVEKYCATDPCDPAAERPANIDETAEKYAAIDVNELLKSRSMGTEDHFFRDARPGMARFAPEAAIAKHREYAASVLTRSGAIQRIGISSFDDHSSVLDDATAKQFLETAAALSSPRDAEQQETRDDWVSSQFALQTGLPHLDGDAQIETLRSLPPHGPPLLKLADVLKPASPDKLEAALEQALASEDHCRQLAALMVARHSGTPLNARAREIVGMLAEAPESSVRSLAFNVIAHEDDEALIRPVVQRGWSVAQLDPHENKIEIFYGSLVMIAAARRGILAEHELLDRIDSELYGYAAQTLGPGVRDGVAARIQAATARAVEIDLPLVPPIVTQQAADTLDPARLSLAEPEEEDGGMEAFIKRLKETDEEFAARQKAGWENFRAFEASLTQAQARLIVEDLGSSAIDALVSASPGGAENLASSLLPLEQRKLRQVANFALRLAQGISASRPDLAEQLFERLAGQSGIVRISYGPSSVPLEALAVWSAPSAELDQLRTARLDQVASDHDLSQEVMAALMAGKADFLEQYARTNLQSPVPADNARALMVLGYGVESAFAEQQLRLPVEPESLIGKARKAGLYAYERNQWAKHWYEKMAATDSAEEFWRYSVLLTKIVDARFDLWESDVPHTRSAIESFGWSIEEDVKRRANAWKTHREKTLCGDKVPSRVFSVVDR